MRPAIEWSDVIVKFVSSMTVIVRASEMIENVIAPQKKPITQHPPLDRPNTNPAIRSSHILICA
jgi:hypothetical protein